MYAKGKKNHFVIHNQRLGPRVYLGQLPINQDWTQVLMEVTNFYL